MQDILYDKIQNKIYELKGKTTALISRWDSVLGKLYDEKTLHKRRLDPNSTVYRFYEECEKLTDIMTEIVSEEVEDRLHQCDSYIEIIKRELTREDEDNNT